MKTLKNSYLYQELTNKNTKTIDKFILCFMLALCFTLLTFILYSFLIIVFKVGSGDYVTASGFFLSFIIDVERNPSKRVENIKKTKELFAIYSKVFSVGVAICGGMDILKSRENIKEKAHNSYYGSNTETTAQEYKIIVPSNPKDTDTLFKELDKLWSSSILAVEINRIGTLASVHNQLFNKQKENK